MTAKQLPYCCNKPAITLQYCETGRVLCIDQVLGFQARSSSLAALTSSSLRTDMV